MSDSFSIFLLGEAGLVVAIYAFTYIRALENRIRKIESESKINS